MFVIWVVRCYFLKFGFKYECISVILSSLSEKKTSGLFKVQGGVSTTEFALIFLTLMPASLRAGAIRIPFALKKIKIFWSEYSVIGWI